MLASRKAYLLLLKVLEGKSSKRFKMCQGTIAIFLSLFQVHLVVLCQLIECLGGYWLSIDGDPFLYGMEVRAASNRPVTSDQIRPTRDSA